MKMGKKRAAKAKEESTPFKQARMDEESEDQPQKQEQKEEKFSLYKMLNLENGSKSTPEEIKRQYRIQAMVCHPDKNLGDESARQKFQKIKEAYEILSDPERKKLYDETGFVGQDMDERAFETAYEFFRSLTKKIQLEDIVDFEKKYRFSEEEQEDLDDYFERHEGNMVELLESIPCCTNEDVVRFIEYFEKNIKEQPAKVQKKFASTKNKVRLLPNEEAEAQEIKKQITKKSQQSMADLVLAIRNKPKNSFLDALQSKYGPAPKKKKVEKADHPTKKPTRK